MKIIVVDLIFSVKLIRALETLNTRMPLFPYQVLVRGVKSNFFFQVTRSYYNRILARLDP